MSKRNYTIEKTAGIILINKKLDKILLIRSSGGFWGFPKGHREKRDKNSLDNAIREVREETNIKVKKNQIISKKKYIVYQYFFRRNSKNPKERKNGWIKKEVILFLALINDKIKIKKQDIEISDFKWMKFDNAIKVISDDEIKKFGKLGSIAKKYIKVIKKIKTFVKKIN